MSVVRHRPLVVGALIAAVLALVIAAAVALGALGGSTSSLPPMMAGSGPSTSGSLPGPSPELPRLAGAVVKVSLTDSGGPMGEGTGMMHPGAMGLSMDRITVPHGTVSVLVTNDGSVSHEVVILPLSGAQVAGARPFGANARVDETGSLGEASKSGGQGEGEGIAAGAVGWVSVTLAPGRYELVCNLPGHYVSGMYGELTVT